jgi:hypothetical protein
MAVRRNRIPVDSGEHRRAKRAEKYAKERVWSRREEIDQRLAIEQSHDAEACKGTLSRAAAVAQYAAAAAGRCSGCGDPIGEVAVCPTCRTWQKITGQRNQAKRKTVGGFCGKSE